MVRSRSLHVRAIRTKGKKLGNYPAYIRDEARLVDRTVDELLEILNGKIYSGALNTELKKWLSMFNMWDMEEMYGFPNDNLDRDIRPSQLIEEYFKDMEHNFWVPVYDRDYNDYKDFLLAMKYQVHKNFGEQYIKDHKMWSTFYYDEDFMRTYGFLVDPNYLLDHFSQEAVNDIMTQNYF